jgi:hypothetical protein
VIAAILALALAQAAPVEPKAPSTEDAPSAVRLLFQAGDLRRAISMAKTCAGSKKKAYKECLVMVKPLVEYQSLIEKGATLTADEAKALFEYQAKISPLTPSRLSAEAQARFVDKPWEQAEAALRGGDGKRASELAQGVLKVQPNHVGAKELLAPSDAGHQKPARDAGR